MQYKTMVQNISCRTRFASRPRVVVNSYCQSCCAQLQSRDGYSLQKSRSGFGDMQPTTWKKYWRELWRKRSLHNGPRRHRVIHHAGFRRLRRCIWANIERFLGFQEFTYFGIIRPKVSAAILQSARSNLSFRVKIAATSFYRAQWRAKPSSVSSLLTRPLTTIADVLVDLPGYWK